MKEPWMLTRPRHRGLTIMRALLVHLTGNKEKSMAPMISRVRPTPIPFSINIHFTPVDNTLAFAFQCTLLRSFCCSGEFQYADMLECTTSLLNLITASFIEKKMSGFFWPIYHDTVSSFTQLIIKPVFLSPLLGRYPDNHDRYTEYFL